MRQRKNYGACAALVVLLGLAARCSAATSDPLLVGNDLDILQRTDTLLKASGRVSLSDMFAPYAATTIIEVGRVLREFHRPAEAKQILALALRRPIADYELAEANYQLALACEVLREGPEVVRLYGEILRGCPDYDRAVEVACRLAELQLSVTLPGCRRDPEKARAILEWAVSRFPNRQDRTLGCHNLLAQACWERGDWRAAQREFLSVYETDVSSLQLPYAFIPDGSTPAALKLESIRKNWNEFRPRLVPLIVNTCILPKPSDSEAALNDLMQRYPGSELAAKAKEKLDQLQKRR